MNYKIMLKCAMKKKYGKFGNFKKFAVLFLREV